MVRSVRCGSSLRTSAPSPMAALRASITSTALLTIQCCHFLSHTRMWAGAVSRMNSQDVVGDWVDVPLGRLEQYQRHIDPVTGWRRDTRN
jgi:hypothetical protein